VDINKLLQNPYSAQAETWSPGFGRRLDIVLPHKAGGSEFSTRGDTDLQAAVAQVLAGSSGDGRAVRPSAQAEPSQDARAGAEGSAPARPALPAEDQRLLNDAMRELRDSAEMRDFKEFWRDTSAELKQFRGGLFFDAPSEEELEQRRSSRQRSELAGGNGPNGGSADSGGRPRSEAEIQRDTVLASVMLKKLIEELTPWAIGAVLTYLLIRGAWAYWRLQKTEQRRRKNSGRRSATGSGRRSGASRSSL